MARQFTELLVSRWAEGKRLCVGFDFYPKKLGQNIYQAIGRESGATDPNDWFSWYAEKYVHATCAFAACYKPNTAFFDSGLCANDWLQIFVSIVNKIAPGVPVILDGKYGDIGATNEQHAERAFGLIRADACTLNPYVGQIGLQPFFKNTDKGFFVLCRTSNPGAGELQDLPITLTVELRKELEQVLGRELNDDSIPLYQLIAYRVSKYWNELGNCGLVVGATYPDELRKVRELAPDVTFLIPGVGTQGGDLAAAVGAAERPHGGGGFIINVSSALMYPELLTDRPASRLSVMAQYFEAITLAAEYYHHEITKALQSKLRT